MHSTMAMPVNYKIIALNKITVTEHTNGSAHVFIATIHRPLRLSYEVQLTSEENELNRMHDIH